MKKTKALFLISGAAGRQTIPNAPPELLSNPPRGVFSGVLLGMLPPPLTGFKEAKGICGILNKMYTLSFDYTLSGYKANKLIKIIFSARNKVKIIIFSMENIHQSHQRVETSPLAQTVPRVNQVVECTHR